MGLHMKIKETERGLWGKEGKAGGLWSPSDARAGPGLPVPSSQQPRELSPDICACFTDEESEL